MKNCKLPDSQEKRSLIQYLEAKIKECEEGIENSEVSQEMSREEEQWLEKLYVYREILNMIR